MVDIMYLKDETERDCTLEMVLVLYFTESAGYAVYANPDPVELIPFWAEPDHGL
jgi:hypothetical protein